MDYRVLIIIFLEELFALFLLKKENIIKDIRSFIVCTLLIVAAFSLRLCFFDYETTDYQWFLTKWVDFYREHAGFQGMKYSNGNYNIPYLYFLALFSYSSVRDLYLIKLLSCFFDVLLAYSGLLFVKKCGASALRSTVCFFLILFLPTVIINSSVWAQCDSIYISLAILGIALALPDSNGTVGKPVLSMICIAVSFGFKLQAVFIMPIFIILWLNCRFKWYHFLIFPITYFIIILPAVFLGRPLSDCLTLYIDQADTVGSSLNYNAPSVFALIGDVTNPETAARYGIIAAFAAMVFIILVAILLKGKLSSRSILCLSLLMVCIIPFLLPHMHDRYFYSSDVLSAILAVMISLAVPCAVFTQFASLICYLAYLKTYYLRIGRTLLTTDKGAIALIFSMLICIICFLSTLTDNRKNIKNQT